MSQLIVPKDAVGLVVAWLVNLRASGVYHELNDMTITGDSLTPGVTPENTIRVSLVGSNEYQRIGDRDSVRVQVWKNGTNRDRAAVVRLISGLARAKLAARIESGLVHLPDPVTRGVTLSQLEFSITMIGESR